MDNKYRVHQLAKDLNLTTKLVTDILTKYGYPPKNHQHPLSPEELSIVFAVVTFDNQVESIEEIFKVEEKPASKKKESPAEAKTEPEAAQAVAKPAASKGKSGEAKQPAAADKPAAEKAAPKKPVVKPFEKSDKPKTDYVHVEREKRVVVMSGATSNIDKYDERLDSFVAERDDRGAAHGKEKITKKSDRNKQGAAAQSAKRRTEERDRLNRLQKQVRKTTPLKVNIPDEISVGELAIRLKKTATDVIRVLMRNGIMSSVSEIIDFDTASIVAMEFRCEIIREVNISIEEKLIDTTEDSEEELVSRAPVIVVMGHVDHGKTSLLDKIRSSSVATGEAGGITQHIGAYRVELNGKPLTFLDTPGHEAFVEMRARGAMITDIAILLVAADDGIMPQTKESIAHAKAANVPVIVAVNKIDLPGANVDRVKQQLADNELVPEEWGGDTVIVPVSARTGEGIDKLLEMIVLTAEMEELRANPSRLAKGAVIEARLDKGRGPIMTVLVQNGTLNQGDYIIAGTAVGRVRTLNDENGNKIESAGPSVPVQVIGMSEVPHAGDEFNAVTDERMARELASERKSERKSAAAATPKVSLDDLFANVQAEGVQTLNIVVKADVQGSAEAVKSALLKLSSDEVTVKVIHSAVGAISKSDVMLADTAGAIVIGFNVRPDLAARDWADRSGTDIRLHSIIYDAIAEVEAAVKGKTAPKYRDVEFGKAEVRLLYKVSKVGTVLGCYVTEGKIVRNCSVRVVRGGEVIYTGELGSLHRFKDDVKEVREGFECGMTVENYNDVQEGDILEAFGVEQIKD
ncbi:MAG: translation initiation factor IF-2 [Oscillospiraceae bacterium]|nr:translation initiation factor IF-2 [Oscillospiraceae bacterium]